MPEPNQMTTWFFDKLGPDDMERNPVSEEFFADGTRLEAVISESSLHQFLGRFHILRNLMRKTA